MNKLDAILEQLNNLAKEAQIKGLQVTSDIILNTIDSIVKEEGL